MLPSESKYNEKNLIKVSYWLIQYSSIGRLLASEVSVYISEQWVFGG